MNWINEPTEENKVIDIYIRVLPEAKDYDQQRKNSTTETKPKEPFQYTGLIFLIIIKLLQCLLLFTVLLFFFLLIKQAGASPLFTSDLKGNYEELRKTIDMESNTTCNTKECIRSAANLLHSMDRTVDPCDNFYQYACGNWHKEHPAQRQFSTNNWFAERDFIIRRRLEGFLEQNNTKNEPKPVHQSRDMFKACVNLLDIPEHEALMPLNKIMKRLGLSIIPPFKNKAKKAAVTNTLALINRLLGKIFFIGVYVHANPFNISENIIVVDTRNDHSLKNIHNENLDLENTLRNHLFQNTDDMMERFSALQEYITLTMKYILEQNNMDVEKFSSSIQEAANKIIKLKALYNKIIFKIPDYDMVSMFGTLDELQEVTETATSSSGQRLKSKIFWKKYLQKLFHGIKSKAITGQTKILISLSSFKRLKSISGLLSETPVSTILLTLWWEVLYQLIPNTTYYLRQIYFDFTRKVLGIPLISSRPLKCSDIVSHTLMYAAGYSSVKEYPQKTRNEVHTMISNIQQSLLKTIRNSKWLDKITKDVITARSKAIKRFIGLPQWLLQKKAIEKYYDGLIINEDTHLENLLNIRELEMKRMLLLFGTINDNATARSHYNPLEVNAYYDPGVHAVIFPSGILQYPFYKLGHRALEYGAFGTVIGHELSHPFDFDSIQYDLWTTSSIEKYMEKLDCFIEKYDTYYIDIVDKYVSGILTLFENVADNGGILASFTAYKNMIKKHGEEKSLPGLTNYTNEQLFFLSFANVWCSKWTEESMLSSLYDVHSPSHIRVLGTLSNLPQFARAWSCPKGAKMNPKKKCKLW